MSSPDRLQITRSVAIPLAEIEMNFVAAQGAGGQNVNKVATAVHLRFSISDSSLPDEVRERLLRLSDQRITSDGVIVIKAQSYRTRERNRQAALRRLQELVRSATVTPKKRKPTRPTAASREKRLDEKGKRSRTKALRGKIRE